MRIFECDKCEKVTRVEGLKEMKSMLCICGGTKKPHIAKIKLVDCPMCKEIMVPSRIEDEEGNWTYGWLCGCNDEIRAQYLNDSERCEHGKGLSDYCAPCGRTHSA